MLILPFRSIVFKEFIFLFVATLLIATSGIATNVYGDEGLPPSQTKESVETPQKEAPSAKEKKVTEPFAFPFEDEDIVQEESNRFFGQFMKMLGTLGVLIAVMFATSWFLKGMLQTRNQQLNISNDIKVLESRPLSNKSSLYLLEVHGKKMLVAETMHNVTLLSTLPKFSLDQDETKGS